MKLFLLTCKLTSGIQKKEQKKREKRSRGTVGEVYVIGTKSVLPRLVLSNINKLTMLKTFQSIV